MDSSTQIDSENIGEVKFDRKIIGLLKDKNDLSNNTVGTIASTQFK